MHRRYCLLQPRRYDLVPQSYQQPSSELALRPRPARPRRYALWISSTCNRAAVDVGKSQAPVQSPLGQQVLQRGCSWSAPWPWPDGDAVEVPFRAHDGSRSGVSSMDDCFKFQTSSTATPAEPGAPYWARASLGWVKKRLASILCLGFARKCRCCLGRRLGPPDSSSGRGGELARYYRVRGGRAPLARFGSSPSAFVTGSGHVLSQYPLAGRAP